MVLQLTRREALVALVALGMPAVVMVIAAYLLAGGPSALFVVVVVLLVILWRIGRFARQVELLGGMLRARR